MALRQSSVTRPTDPYLFPRENNIRWNRNKPAIYPTLSMTTILYDSKERYFVRSGIIIPPNNSSGLSTCPDTLFFWPRNRPEQSSEHRYPAIVGEACGRLSNYFGGELFRRKLRIR